ncbi:MAG: hypothetical protein E7160_02870 [Firmicutes bacterium]|nr:hypothetical protein [Bacillota bacterium]
MQDIKDFQIQHQNNYKNAIREILKNNSKILVEEDIMSLINKPPLDSMDIIKCKFLDLAKKQKVVLDTKKLDKLIDNYRKDIKKDILIIKDERIKLFDKIIESFNPVKDNDVIKFNKKDFNDFNKKVKKELKDKIILKINNNIVNNVNTVFTKDTDDKKQEKISSDIIKFLTKTYVKQLLESVDFKVLVKDTTLINGVKEQGERYIFTKMNSYLLNEDKMK